MKKAIFIIATATIVASCSSNDAFKDVETGNTAINFTSYAQPTTKATENNQGSYDWSLNNHHLNFLVFGYRTKNTTNQWVFQEQEVGYSSGAWSYEPVRYWDKTQDSYTFFAAAPVAKVSNANIWKLEQNASTESGYNSSYTENAYYFTYSGLELTDHDATVKGNDGKTPYVESFAIAAPNKDLMITADSCTTSDYANPVNLQFIHILSRLNIIVQRGDKLSDADVVKIKSFEVCGFKKGGDFKENLAIAVATVPGTNARWTNLSDNKINYTTSANVLDENNNIDLEVLYDAKSTASHEGHDVPQYILQSLVIPQDITWENINWNGTGTKNQAYLHIKYTIYNPNWNANSQTEEYETYYNLATAFGAKNETGKTTVAFNEGWQNNLKLQINPAIIDFTPSVSTWSDRDFVYEIK